MPLVHLQHKAAAIAAKTEHIAAERAAPVVCKMVLTLQTYKGKQLQHSGSGQDLNKL